MPKTNYQQKSTPDARTAASKWGRKEEEPAALLRVRTGQKALRAVGGAFLNCGRAEKLTHSQNKGTEKLQRRAAPSPLEVGGRGRGGGQTQPQRSHPLPPGKQARVPI